MNMTQLVPYAQTPGVTVNFTHITRYSYSGPVLFGNHRLVMRPRESYHQRLEKIEITTSPPSEISWTEDIFGNMVATLNFLEAGPELAITSRFSVWRSTPPEGIHGPEGILVSVPSYYSGIEQAATYLYRNAVYPRQVELVRKWVMDQRIMGAPGDDVPLFDRMAAAIRKQIAYQRREVSGVQSPKETLKIRTGSCRDTAVLMMEAARSIGFAARFVSGYLESEVSRVGRGATHAWTEVYLPDRGWTGFDPSIGEQVDIGHIAVGVCYHPRGVMPISGTFKAQGNHPEGMSVEISSSRS
jgi:transglutaminase-like putative cysteine protease